MRLVPTGRKWGDKRDPEKAKVKMAGASVVVHSQDFWEGPVEAHETGQYMRGFWFE